MRDRARDGFGGRISTFSAIPRRPSTSPFLYENTQFEEAVSAWLRGVKLRRHARWIILDEGFTIF